MPACWLVQVLEKWDPALLERHLDAIEAAILAAAQDAQSETRAAGRLMYAIYGSAWPQQASTMLQHIERDRPLQEKLLQALEAYQPSEQSVRTMVGHAATWPVDAWGHLISARLAQTNCQHWMRATAEPCYSPAAQASKPPTAAAASP